MANDRPKAPITHSAREASLSGIERDLQGEQAASLGRYGREVERALAALRATGDIDPDARAELVQDAAKAVWRYFIQREAVGLRNHDLVVQHYAIPGEVLARVGSGRP